MMWQHCVDKHLWVQRERVSLVVFQMYSFQCVLLLRQRKKKMNMPELQHEALFEAQCCFRSVFSKGGTRLKLYQLHDQKPT